MATLTSRSEAMRGGQGESVPHSRIMQLRASSRLRRQVAALLCATLVLSIGLGRAAAEGPERSRVAAEGAKGPAAAALFVNPARNQKGAALRARPLLRARVVVTIPNNARVQVSGGTIRSDGRGWYRALYKSHQGYLLSTALTKQSPLRRHDTPPGGVAAQLAAPNAPDTETTVYPGLQLDLTGQGSVPIPSYGPQLFILGYQPSTTVTVKVTMPNGQIDVGDISIGANGNALWTWAALPGDPLGSYSVQLSQSGTPSADVRFNVARSSAPDLLVLWPRTEYLASIIPGRTVHVALGGYAPDSRVRVFLYYQRQYTTELPPAQTDIHGEAFYSLQTSSGDPEGEYTLITQPPTTTLVTGGPQLAYDFTLSRPPRKTWRCVTGTPPCHSLVATGA